MGNFSILQVWAGGIIFLFSAYDVLINQFVPPLMREKYYLYSLGWSLQTWITILLAVLVIVLLWNNGKQKVEEDTEENKKSNSARGGSSALQAVNDSQIYKDVNGSFNKTYNLVSPDYPMPTKEQILRRIGVEIQELDDQFKIVRYRPLEHKYDEWVKANEIFERIRTGVLRQANIALKGSQILDLFKSLELELARYPLQINIAIQNEADRMHYGQVDKAELPTVIERIHKANEVRGNSESTITLAIQQIITLSQGNDGNDMWWIS